MIILLSPSKNMNEYDHLDCFSQPEFLNKSKLLMNELTKMNINEIKNFMGISQKLAELNFNRYQSWNTPFTKINSSPAIFSFTGDVYESFDVKSLTKKQLDIAQDKLRILSGLYGILKPFDLIQPYRLEMGKKLSSDKFKNLYQFWNDEITTYLNKISYETIVNLASNEYFNVIDRKKLSKKLITPIFKDFKNNKYKVISFYAKKARGKMAKFIIQHDIKKYHELIMFNLDGYKFNPDLSSNENPVFTRSTV